MAVLSKEKRTGLETGHNKTRRRDVIPLHPAAVPAIPFSSTLFNSSASLTGGKHVIPEHTTATALSFGK